MYFVAHSAPFCPFALAKVFGVGIPNPYRLRPFIGARVPVNSSFSPLIHIHNPYSEPLQVSYTEQTASHWFKKNYRCAAVVRGLMFCSVLLCSCRLKVVEMYSSGGDLHLELPTGQQGGTGKLWVSPLVPAEPLMQYGIDTNRPSVFQEIPPFETKGVMRASFSSRDVDNHTAFIRIKTNAPDEDQFIILPVEVEVTSGASTPTSQ